MCWEYSWSEVDQDEEVGSSTLSSYDSTYEDMEESVDSDDDMEDMEISSAEQNSILTEGSMEEIPCCSSAKIVTVRLYLEIS